MSFPDIETQMQKIMRGVEEILSGNRFMIYSLYEAQNIEIRVMWGKDKQNVVFACGAVLLVWAFFSGLLDRLTWGHWFQSAIVYLKFNLIEGKSAQWGTTPFDYYPCVLLKSMEASAIVLAGLSLVAEWPKSDAFAVLNSLKYQFWIILIFLAIHLTILDHFFHPAHA